MFIRYCPSCGLKWKQFINIHLQSSNSTWRFQLSYLSFVVWHFKIFFQVELRGNIGLKYKSSLYLINQRNWEVECFCTEGPSTAIQSQGCNLDIFVFRSNLSHESVRIRMGVMTFLKRHLFFIFGWPWPLSLMFSACKNVNKTIANCFVSLR